MFSGETSAILSQQSPSSETNVEPGKVLHLERGHQKRKEGGGEIHWDLAKRNLIKEKGGHLRMVKK